MGAVLLRSTAFNFYSLPSVFEKNGTFSRGEGRETKIYMARTCCVNNVLPSHLHPRHLKR